MVGGGLAVAACCALLSLSTTSGGPAAGHAVPGAVVVGAASAGLADARMSPAEPVRLKTVRYRGYAFRVPASWPVVDDRSGSRGCVRFDQHAVYLGAVSGDQFCPSWLLGTTESILIQPGPAHVIRRSLENPVARQITVRAPGITVFATFDTDPTVIYQILASASLPAPVVAAASPSQPVGGGGPSARAHLDGAAAMTGQVRSRVPRRRHPMAAPALPNIVASFHGLGFDACTAPSRSTMNAWRQHSPYQAIGIYVGGADRACAQPNLTQSWVRTQAAAGWHFIPLYAGPQAAFGELHAAARQGKAAAQDAAVQMHALGFGRRTPVYYDMEAFGPKVRASALRFLSAWTVELHRLGYLSGIYSSSDSGIAALSWEFSRKKYAMPNIVYDALWNGRATTRDRNLRSGQWHHRRIHQFSGNVTQRFGGRTINIDQDFLDVHIRPRRTTAQATSAVTLPDGSVDLFYRARAGQLWFDRYVPKVGWAKARQTSAVASSIPSVVWTGGSVDVFYKDRAGHLRIATFSPGGRMTAHGTLSGMGIIGSAPRAVAQPDGTIDVFWRGSADDHLWHGQYLPGSGWNGPQGLGGALASGPSPVVSLPGATTVFWEGADKALWWVHRGLLGRWSAPRSLGMGPLGGPPQATAQEDGGIQVYWHGSGNSKVWEGFYRPGSGWRGPRDLGGEVQSVPWPATADGTVRVLWQGSRHKLDYLRHRLGQGWNSVGWQGPFPAGVGWLGSAPFASVGSPTSSLAVFWLGRQGRLWTASVTGAGWSKATKLAG